MEIVVRSLIGIFTIIDGKIYLIIDYKDLPNTICNDNVEKENQRYLDSNLNIDNLDLKQCYTFSEKENNVLQISILYTDIVNCRDIRFNKFILVPVEDIPRNVYIDKLMEYLRKNLVLNSTIKKLYPKEFVLPEIQKIYENLLNKKYDRRNFRKRLIKMDIIEDLNKMSLNKKGRPAKLYRFKDITEDKILF